MRNISASYPFHEGSNINISDNTEIHEYKIGSSGRFFKLCNLQIPMSLGQWPNMRILAWLYQGSINDTLKSPVDHIRFAIGILQIDRLSFSFK